MQASLSTLDSQEAPLWGDGSKTPASRCRPSTRPARLASPRCSPVEVSRVPRGRAEGIQARGHAPCPWHELPYQLQPRQLSSDILMWTRAGSQAARAAPAVSPPRPDPRARPPAKQVYGSLSQPLGGGRGLGEASEGRTDEKNKGG